MKPALFKASIEKSTPEVFVAVPVITPLPDIFIFVVGNTPVDEVALALLSSNVVALEDE